MELPAARRASEIQNVIVFLDTDVAEASKPMWVVIRHNVFSLSSAATFDLGRYPRSTSKSRMFTRPGVVKVFCHLHAHMSAIVRVCPHPHFGVPDAQGHVTLDGLPAGPHVVTAWHERVGGGQTWCDSDGRRSGDRHDVSTVAGQVVMAGNRPWRAPRLVVKVVAFSFATTACVLGAVFIVLTWQARQWLTATMTQGMEQSQRRFARLQEHKRREPGGGQFRAAGGERGDRTSWAP